MAKNSGIDWTDHTWNPWQGCRKVSPGCLNCYMYRDKKRYGQDPATVIRSKPATFNSPLKWKDPAKVFVCSWSDFFIEDAGPWRDDAWDIIRQRPHLTFQILTKRPENIKDRLPEDWPLPNVWMGVTCENQEMYNKRVPFLVELDCVTFVSIEPMIGFIHPHYPEMIDWMIVGGETGPDARFMDPEWAAHLKDACSLYKIPFFMKQMTNKAPIPEYLQGREFPK